METIEVVLLTLAIVAVVELLIAVPAAYFAAKAVARRMR